jgi:hypothetical protein
MALTNRDMLRQLACDGTPGQPCEWDPRRDMPARLKDPYHDIGTIPMVSVCDGEPCQVCERCAEEARHHKLLIPAVRARKVA